MTRRLLIALAVLALIAAALAGLTARTRPSGATFTTSSQSDVTASVDTVSNWLHLYSEFWDPQGDAGYARRREVGGADGLPAASGVDDSLVVDLGDFPDKNKRYDFVRVFSLRTPDSFPDPAISQISVTVSVLPDPATGDKILQKAELTPFDSTAKAVQTATLGPGVKYQFNVTVWQRKKFTLGQTYFPLVRLSLNVGGVADAFAWEIPLEVKDAGGD